MKKEEGEEAKGRRGANIKCRLKAGERPHSVVPLHIHSHHIPRKIYNIFHPILPPFPFPFPSQILPKIVSF
jgi:hypothetical protein